MSVFFDDTKFVHSEMFIAPNDDMAPFARVQIMAMAYQKI